MEVFKTSNVPFLPENLKRSRKSDCAYDNDRPFKRRATDRWSEDEADSNAELLFSAELNLLENSAPFSQIYGTFGHQWYGFEREREVCFPFGMPSLGAAGSEVERRRLDTLRSFWQAARRWNLALPTVEVAFAYWGRLLQHHITQNPVPSRPLSCKDFASSATAAFRIALKFQERVETLWEVPKSPWDVLEVFNAWPIDRSAEALMQSECESLKILGPELDVPLPSKFFDRLLTVGGWPPEIASECSKLGHYLLALSQFSTGTNHLREKTEPCRLAAAVLALTVKIVNLDVEAKLNCQPYDFFPPRLELYTGYDFKQDLQSAVRQLSTLLRSKPPEAEILEEFFPVWGVHQWV